VSDGYTKVRSESKERFAIQRYLLIIGKKQYAGFITHLHLLLHIVTLDTEALVYRDTNLLIPSSYQKAAWPNVHKFCGIVNVR